MTVVLGVDGARRGAESGWVCVGLRDGRLDEFSFHPEFVAVLRLAKESHADAVGVDIPIGHEGAGAHRAADVAARGFLGPRASSSVFFAPPRPVLQAPTHETACDLARRNGWPAPSAQLWGIRPRLVDVDASLRSGSWDALDVREVHPEVSFRALAASLGRAGEPTHPKRSWNGLVERLDLLRQAGLRPTRSYGGIGSVGPDDVLDATVAAWTAARIAGREAASLPAAPPTDALLGRPVAIWA